MQAFVRSKHTQPRKDEARAVLDLESLKVPVPDLDGARQPHLTKPHHAEDLGAAGRDHGELLEANKHFRSTPSAALRARPIIPLTPDELAGFDNIDNFDAGFTAVPEDRLERLKQQKLAELPKGLLIDKYIDGDSYPDTTSGQLSDDDAQSFSRPPFQPHAFASPFKRKAEQRGQIQQPQSIAAPPRPIAALFVRDDNESIDASGFQMVQRGQPIKKNGEQPKGMHKRPRSSAQPRPATSGAQSTGRVAVEQIPVATDRSKDPIFGPPSHDKPVLPHVHDDTAQLDYDESVLENMQYEDLKHETFDLDPRATLDDLRDSVVLDTLPPEHWAEHFQALDIDKWEEAGDQLIGRYADILKKLTAIRRGRRETARAYEMEVEQRHDLIVRRRIVIRDTMDGMRTHGTQVLIKNTPS